VRRNPCHYFFLPSFSFNKFIIFKRKRSTQKIFPNRIIQEARTNAGRKNHITGDKSARTDTATKLQESKESENQPEREKKKITSDRLKKARRKCGG